MMMRRPLAQRQLDLPALGLAHDAYALAIAAARVDLDLGVVAVAAQKARPGRLPGGRHPADGHEILGTQHARRARAPRRGQQVVDARARPGPEALVDGEAITRARRRDERLHGGLGARAVVAAGAASRDEREDRREDRRAN